MCSCAIPCRGSEWRTLPSRMCYCWCSSKRGMKTQSVSQVKQNPVTYFFSVGLKFRREKDLFAFPELTSLCFPWKKWKLQNLQKLSLQQWLQEVKDFECITAKNFWTKGNKGNGGKMNFTELLPWCQFVVWPSGINLSICSDCKSSMVWYLIWVLPVCLEAGRVPAGPRWPWQRVIHTCRLSCSLPSAGNGRGTQHPCRQSFLSSAAVWWDQRDSDKDLRSSWLC